MHLRWQLAVLAATSILLVTASGAFAVSQLRTVTAEQEAALGLAADTVASAERLRGLAMQETAQVLGYMRGAGSLADLNETRDAFGREADRMERVLPEGYPLDLGIEAMRTVEARLLDPPASMTEGDLLDTILLARAHQDYVFNDTETQFFRLGIFYGNFGNLSLNRTSGPVWAGLGIQRSAVSDFEHMLNTGRDPRPPIEQLGKGHGDVSKWLRAHSLVRLAEIEATFQPEQVGPSMAAAFAAARVAVEGYDANASAKEAEDVAAALSLVAREASKAGADLAQATVPFPPFQWTELDALGSLLVHQHAIQTQAHIYFDLAISLRATADGSLTSTAADLRTAAANVVYAAEAEAAIAKAKVDGRIAATQTMAIATALLAVIATGAVAAFTVHKISARLHSFDKAAAAVGRGEFQVPPPPPANDEFDGLADSWAAMTGALTAREAEIRQKNNALVASERLASVGSLIAGVAHEVNNPLAFVKANEDLVADDLRALIGREDIRADPDVMRVLEDSISAMQANREGIERVEQVSLALKGLSGPARARALLDINAVSEGILILAHASLRNKIRVERRYSTVPKVLGESRELGQIVLNLVLNAAQVAPPGSSLEIMTRYDGGYVYLTVKDEGPGVPDEVRGRLFEAFVTTKEDGTGLGLHLSREIARSHGGDLYLEDTTEGAAFTLRLPQGESTRVAAPARAEPAPVAQAPMPRAR